MKIRFDYSWMPAQARKDIERHDPSKNDFAITQEDYEKIGAKKMDRIRTIARQYVDLPKRIPPYIVMASSGKTLFVPPAKKPEYIIGKGYVRLFNKKGDAEVGKLMDVYENTSGYEILDDTPPRFIVDSGTLFGLADNILTGVLDGEFIAINLKYISVYESNAHITIIVDGHVQGSKHMNIFIMNDIELKPNADPSSNYIHIPKDAKEIQLRISDQFGNARKMSYSRVDIDNRVIFIQHRRAEKDQRKIFQQHVRRLISLGYDVYIGGGHQSHGNPLAYLMKYYSEQLFSTPDMHLNKKIEIQDIGQIGNKRTNVLHLVNWLTGQTIFSKTWQNSAELKRAVIANSRLYLDSEGKIRPLSLKDIIPGEKRATPILIARSEHKPIIPDKLSAVHFNIDIAPDIAWGRREFEIGNIRHPLHLKRTGQELMDEPIAVMGNVKRISFKVPYSVKQPSDAEVLIDKKVDGQDVHIWKREDLFGNVIIYTEEVDREIIILPHKPADNESHRIDLSPLGIGTIQDLVAMDQQKPIAHMGQQKQYQLFAHEKHLTPRLQAIIKDIEDVEGEFGVKPGYFVKTIHIDEDMGKNALITPADASRMTIFEGMLYADSHYIYHEVLHMIDYKWHISSDPAFTTLYERIKQKKESFFTWINESNFFPKGQGGHAQDNAGELFASLGNSLTSAHIITHLGRSDPHFVRIYQESLQTLHHIIKKRIAEKQLPKQMVFMKRLEDAIAHIPHALQVSEERNTPKTNTRARLPSHVSLFSKWRSPLVGGLMIGNGFELPLIYNTPFATRLHMGWNIAMHNEDNYISFLPEIGLKPVIEFKGIHIGADIGGALKCEWDDIDYGLQTGLFIEYAQSKNHMHRWGIKALSFSDDDIWIGLQFSSSLLLK